MNTHDLVAGKPTEKVKQKPLRRFVQELDSSWEAWGEFIFVCFSCQEPPRDATEPGCF